MRIAALSQEQAKNRRELDVLDLTESPCRSPACCVSESLYKVFNWGRTLRSYLVENLNDLD